MNLQDIGAGKIIGSMIPEASDDIRLRIGNVMEAIGRVKIKEIDEEMERIGLTEAQVRVLLYILQNGGGFDREITARELEERFRVSNPTMSGILKRLEKKEFIERFPGSFDKRNKQIRIKGDREGLYRMIRNRTDQEKRIAFAGFTREELEKLLELLIRLYQNMENVGNEE